MYVSISITFVKLLRPCINLKKLKNTIRKTYQFKEITQYTIMVSVFTEFIKKSDPHKLKITLCMYMMF